MKRQYPIHPVLSALVAACFTLGGFAQEPTVGFRDLQGTWIVTAGEHEGQPMDAIIGGTLVIGDGMFELRTASGNELGGELRLGTTEQPRTMDFLHRDGELRGTTWLGIYELDGGRLRINYIDSSEPRPARFETSPETEASLVVLERRQNANP